MAGYDPINLGRAVTSLGLDSYFLSEGGLEGFSLLEKSGLVTGIVDENLEKGRWQAVLAMVYGGSSNVDILYDGDRSELKNRILKSAKKSPVPPARETIRTLRDKGEQELLFRLTTEVPFDYKTLRDLTDSIREYLSDPEQGAQRTKTLNLVLGRAAFKNKEFGTALRYFEEAEDTEGIGKIFEAVISKKKILDKYSMADLGMRAALADSAQKESRLKRLVLEALPKKGNMNPWRAFQIFKKYGVSLSSEERNTLYDRAAAEGISRHDIKEIDDSEFSLRWAKKHADSDPKEAYQILSEKEPDGEDVLKAAISGIKYRGDSRKRESHGLSLYRINEAHLKKLLLEAPFDIRAKVARHLKDKEALKSLSREALEKGKKLEAYNLWIEGGGNPKDPDISKIRTKLITGKVSGSKRFFFDLGKDPVGAVEYYDALIKKGDFKEAHEVALGLGDNERAQRTREKILEGDLEKALSFFVTIRETIDEKGLEDIVKKTAEIYDIPKELVIGIISKHHPYVKK